MERFMALLCTFLARFPIFAVTAATPMKQNCTLKMVEMGDEGGGGWWWWWQRPPYKQAERLLTGQVQTWCPRQCRQHWTWWRWSAEAETLWWDQRSVRQASASAGRDLEMTAQHHFLGTGRNNNAMLHFPGSNNTTVSTFLSSNSIASSFLSSNNNTSHIPSTTSNLTKQHISILRYTGFL